MKRNYKSKSNRRFRFNQTSRGLGAITRLSTISAPAAYQNSVMGGPGLYTATSGLSFAAATAVVLNPTFCGDRAQTLASQFAQWRIRNARLTYRTCLTISTAASATPLNGTGAFVYGWQADPANLPVDFYQGLEYGGVQGSVDRHARTIQIPPSPWKWFVQDSTSTFANTRDQCHGGIFLHNFTNPASAAADYGVLVLEVNWEFKGMESPEDSVSRANQLILNGSYKHTASRVPPVVGDSGSAVLSDAAEEKPLGKGTDGRVDSPTSCSGEEKQAQAAYQLRHAPLLSPSASDRPIASLKGDYVVKFNDDEMVDATYVKLAYPVSVSGKVSARDAGLATERTVTKQKNRPE